ncbi:hypothetical protein QQF64_002547 [Cirrhinus molitorella]|uniref:Uncharacterized protein n=1 Tax=Cirrhinus molitorella TaxID=172907 RepID=A0ABR3MQJ2_9TELE
MTLQHGLSETLLRRNLGRDPGSWKAYYSNPVLKEGLVRGNGCVELGKFGELAVELGVKLPDCREMNNFVQIRFAYPLRGWCIRINQCLPQV